MDWYPHLKDDCKILRSDISYSLHVRSFTLVKTCLRWRGPRLVLKKINYYVYQIEDLRNGFGDEVHVSRLNFYNDRSLDKQEIIAHVLTP